MSSHHCELGLDEILADCIVKAVMEADSVDPRELEAELRQTAALLRARRLTLAGPTAPRSDFRRKRGIT